MTMIVLEDKGCQLSVVDGVLRCNHPEAGIKTIPWNQVAQIMIGKGIQLTSDVILALAERGVSLLVSGSRPQQNASLAPLTAPSSQIKLKQYAVFTHQFTRKKWARKLIEFKAKSQLRALRRFSLPTPYGWDDTVDTILNSEHTMLAEAHLAKLYWAQWRILFAHLGFNNRERRPPTDPVNAILSLSSTLEDGLYCKALLAQGLDIGLGFHHVTGYRRHSLIYDMKEFTRSAVECWVAELFHCELLTPEHFLFGDHGVRLNRQGQAVFYRAWYEFKRSHMNQVQRIAKLVRKLIDREARIIETTMAD